MKLHREKCGPIVQREAGEVGSGMHEIVFKKLSDNWSVYTAEIVATLLALHWEKEVALDRVVIDSDYTHLIYSIMQRGHAR